jgi:hypothetical protein
MSQRAPGVVVALLLLHLPGATSAQPGQVQVSYDVEFSTTGADLGGSGSCGAAVGYDKLSGTLMGWEPAPAHEDNTYYGDLIRDTNVTFCYVATHPNKPDEAYNCLVKITGRARVPVEFDMYADGRGGYLRAQDTGVTVMSSSVTGTCDPSEMAQWQRDYGTMSTAGSPDGQPVEVSALPRIGPFPRTFPPRPPRSIWTLKVLGRRP